jgi:Ni,Fe-hydrogenase III small subunit
MRSSRYPSSMFSLIIERLSCLFKRKPLYSEPIVSENDLLARGKRSLFMRHLDCGSCNGCELELTALSNPMYDCERFGIRFEASPRHSDILVLTGVLTQNLAEAADLTLAAMSQPRRVIVIGDCALGDGLFRNSYALAPPSQVLEEAIVARVAGCPPAPSDILRALAEVDRQCRVEERSHGTIPQSYE